MLSGSVPLCSGQSAWGCHVSGRCWQIQAPGGEDGEQPAHLEEGSVACTQRSRLVPSAGEPNRLTQIAGSTAARTVPDPESSGLHLRPAAKMPWQRHMAGGWCQAARHGLHVPRPGCQRLGSCTHTVTHTHTYTLTHLHTCTL